MVFQRLADVRISHADAVFADSKWNKALGVLVCLLLTAIPIWIAVVGRSIIFGISGGVMVLITLGFFKLFLKTLSPANWLMRITSARQVVIKYRSFANAHFPVEDLVAFTLERGEIKWVRNFVQKTILPDSGNGHETRTSTYLEIGVDPVLTTQLEPKLTEERLREAPAKGAMKVRTKVQDYPVSVTEAGVVRVRWRGPTAWISPSVDEAIKQISQWATAQEPRQTMTDFTSIKKPDAAAEERIMELAQSGDTIAATKLVRRVYGMSLTEARKFVEALVGGRTREE